MALFNSHQRLNLNIHEPNKHVNNADILGWMLFSSEIITHELPERVCRNDLT